MFTKLFFGCIYSNFTASLITFITKALQAEWKKMRILVSFVLSEAVKLADLVLDKGLFYKLKISRGISVMWP